MSWASIKLAIFWVITLVLIAEIFALAFRIIHLADMQDAAALSIKIKWEDARLVRVCPNSTFIYRLKDGEFWTGDREGYRSWSRQTELKVC